jgi:hypothetical protein
MSSQIYEKPAKKRLLSYSKDTFPMYAIWFKDFFTIHHQIFEFIGENLENYYKKFDEVFFEWLNKSKNRSKFMFEIKKEFMAIADDVLIQEILLEQYRKTQFCFVIGPLQKYLEFFENDDSPIDGDINMYPEINPNYQLFEEQPIIQNFIQETNIDSDYYLSFFK